MQNDMSLPDAIEFCLHFHDACTGKAELSQSNDLRIPFREIYFGEDHGYSRDGVSTGSLHIRLKEPISEQDLDWLSFNMLIDLHESDGVTVITDGEREVKLAVITDRCFFRPQAT